jgi:PKD repeat protein
MTSKGDQEDKDKYGSEIDITDDWWKWYCDDGDNDNEIDNAVNIYHNTGKYLRQRCPE